MTGPEKLGSFLAGENYSESVVNLAQPWALENLPDAALPGLTEVMSFHPSGALMCFAAIIVAIF